MNEIAAAHRTDSRAHGLRPAFARTRMWAGAVVGVLGCALVGCTPGPRVLMPDEQHVIGRELVEYPANTEFRRFATGFNAPSAMYVDGDGSVLVAEGERGQEPHIWRIPKNGGRPSLFYPQAQQVIPLHTVWKMYGPIGGITVVDGNVIVTHRDENDMGVVTALDSKGGHKTLCAGFPTPGDYGLTDITYDPHSNRLWFGCGTVTNGGVVGLDNLQIGWVRAHPEAHDQPFHDIELLGYKFQSVNPMAGLFGPAEVAVTAAFQPFNQSFAIRVKGSPDGRPGGAIYSVAVAGGFPSVEAYGIHNPRGIGFNEFGSLYITNDGMEMRGARPVKGDPDALLHPPFGQPWLGWPDYSADLRPISDPVFQPPEYMSSKYGYLQIRALIDLNASGLTAPVRDTMLEAVFPSLSGAGKIAFVPPGGPFSKDKDLANNVIVTLTGDRSPYASGGIALPARQGFKLVRVDLDHHLTHEFIRNVGDMPGSKIDPRNRSLIERPVDIKFGPDGDIYILDEGHMEVRNGIERFEKGTGQIFRLVVNHKPTTAPAQ